MINMSLGGAGTSPIEQAAVTAARDAGTVVIAAAAGVAAVAFSETK